MSVRGERENELHEMSFGFALVGIESPTVSVRSCSYGLLWRLSTGGGNNHLLCGTMFLIRINNVLLTRMMILIFLFNDDALIALF